ncbi:hypothetical protein RJ640_020781 [Escallonia rubra]|uniref:High mobility group B protein 9 n=2 Tax=Escallonia rubra TaxID=112253 RepID=A0AA88UAJ2_9ASTE|nr:hypothetical protein RJ640_020781 [Escallonia rubra]
MSAKSMLPYRNGVEDARYPPPLASHEDVVKDPLLFWDTLRSFHSALGTKFMVPVIGGKELNLHVLYVEVTKKGGYDKVVTEKKWREVSSVFNFSPTTTSASYALRKHYFSYLHHYEKLYFFKLQGPLLASAAEKETSCFKATGTIDGKFDCGYLVSVKVGTEILNGVLYHPEQPCVSMSTMQPCTALVPYNSKPHLAGRKRRRRRKGDPSRPKPNRSGYNFFFAEKHSKLKSLYPHREREFTKMIGESWNNLNQEERLVYQNIGLKDKERYQREMKEYKERRMDIELKQDKVH